MTDEPVDSRTDGTTSRTQSETDGVETPIYHPGSNGEVDTDGEATTGGSSPPTPLAAAIGRIRRDPTLALPFVIAGVLLAVVDWVRRHDPLPTLVSDDGEGISISVEFVGYPTGISETTRSIESLVDLYLPYLAWGIGLEVAALAVVAGAGTVTIARALDEAGTATGSDVTGRIRRLLAYLGLVALFASAGRVLGSVGEVGPVLGLPLFVAVCVALVRFFVAPAFVVTGSGPIAALRRSNRVTRGSGWSIFALVLAFGLAAWLLTLVPLAYAGPVLSSALVASVHAVTVAVVWERADEAETSAR
ncbi:hypothetical protein [Natronorubrum sp. FCH18a]|uniref:hypothetical protein n=1 Tax=Natronorubrum sp. FCH18a TaxID=3447018 RepID=UPI003F5168DC